MDLKDIISDIMDNITDNEDFRNISSSFKNYKRLVNTGMSQDNTDDIDDTDNRDNRNNRDYSQNVNYGINVENNVVSKDSYGEPLVFSKVDMKPMEEKSLIKAISEEITPSKLKEAIILSEIINKPVCKRSRRGFRRV